MKRFGLWTLSVTLTALAMGAYRAYATVTANSIVTAQTPNRGVQGFIATASCTGSGTPFSCCTGSGTGCAAGGYQTYYTAGANGSKCNSVVIATNDGTAQHVMTLEIVNGGVSYPLCSFTTALAPTNNTTYSTTNQLSSTNCPGLPVDSDGNAYLQMISGDTLKGTFGTNLTASDQIIAYPVCADF